MLSLQKSFTFEWEKWNLNDLSQFIMFQKYFKSYILEPCFGLANSPGCILASCLVTAGIGSSSSVTLIRNKLYLTEDG